MNNLIIISILLRILHERRCSIVLVRVLCWHIP